MTQKLDKCPGCQCPSIILSYRATQQEKCPKEEGYCFKLLLYYRDENIELRTIDTEPSTSTSSLLFTPENTDYKIELGIKEAEFLIEILPLEDIKVIESSSFIIKVNEEDNKVGTANSGGIEYILETKEKALTVEKSNFSPG